jgi:hypothetical protein
MQFRTETRSIAAIYITLYLCLLAPLHLLHLEPTPLSHSQLAQACGDECFETPHHSGSCPTCQLGSGLIDLPIEVEFSSALTPIAGVVKSFAAGVTPWVSAGTSPRAPPICA